MPKERDDLTSEEGKEHQETDQGLTIPVPKRKDFLDNLRKTAKRKDKPSNA